MIRHWRDTDVPISREALLFRDIKVWVRTRAGHAAEKLQSRGVAEPRLCKRPVSGVRPGQLSDHAALGSGMRKHIYKVHHHNIKLILLQIGELAQKPFAASGIVDLIVGELALSPVTAEKRRYQLAFIEVLPLVLILVDPQMGEHARYFLRHQTFRRHIRISGRTLRILLVGMDLMRCLPIQEPSLLGHNTVPQLSLPHGEGLVDVILIKLMLEFVDNAIAPGELHNETSVQQRVQYINQLHGVHTCEDFQVL